MPADARNLSANQRGQMTATAASSWAVYVCIGVSDFDGGSSSKLQQQAIHWHRFELTTYRELRFAAGETTPIVRRAPSRNAPSLRREDARRRSGNRASPGTASGSRPGEPWGTRRP